MSEPSEKARPTPTPATPPTVSNMSNVKEALRTVAAQVLVISDAQFAIWKLQAVRVGALILLAIPLALGFLGMAFYGVILLDQAAAAALRTVGYPEWFSPLVRGGAYTFLTLIVMFTIWRQCIGSFSSKK